MSDVAWQRRQETIDELTHTMHLARRRYIIVNVPPGTERVMDYIRANGIALERCPYNPSVIQIAEPWDLDHEKNGWKVYTQWSVD